MIVTPLVAIIIMDYLAVTNVLTPERFFQIRIAREVPVQARLKRITPAKNVFHDVYNRYTPMDGLCQFLTGGKLFYIRSESDYTDAMCEAGMGGRWAVARGLTVRDTVWLSVRDSLPKDGMTSEEFLQAPGSPESIIRVDAASTAQEIDDDVAMMSIFHMVVLLLVYLANQDHRLLSAAIKEVEAHYQGTRYPGLVLGSLEEVKSTGSRE